jgi:Domain of unknown function (DUF1704)
LTAARAALFLRGHLAPEEPPHRQVEAVLLELESLVSLLDRVQPPRWPKLPLDGYGPLAQPMGFRPAQGGEEEQCARLVRSAGELLERCPAGLRTRHLAARLGELVADWELVRHLGTPRVRQTARARLGAMGAAAQEGLETARAWAQLEPETSSHPMVIVRELARERVRQLPIPVRILEANMGPRAAIGEGALFLRPDLRLPLDEAEGLLLHELDGHLLPRSAARDHGAPLAVGAEGASIDEEGFALWLEMASGLFPVARRRQLALRHLAALCVLDERPMEEAGPELEERGYSREAVFDALARALRGGGLCREAFYLPALLRVSGLLRQHPDAESLFRAGRVSASFVRELFDPELPLSFA